MHEVGLELRLVFFYLRENFLVSVRDGIRDRGGCFTRFGIGLIRQRTARKHVRKLRGIVSPRGKNLRPLIQIVPPHFVKSVRLAVMRFVVFGAVLNAEETRNADIVERSVIGTK